MKEANSKFNWLKLRGAQRSLWLLLALVAGLGLQPRTAGAQPTNDAFTNAIVITGVFGTVGGTNDFATLETCEPATVATDDNGPVPVDTTVWYKWTAPTNGVVTFDTINSDFDTVLAVYTRRKHQSASARNHPCPPGSVRTLPAWPGYSTRSPCRTGP